MSQILLTARLLTTRLRSEKGQTMAEYAVVLAMISIGVVAAFTALSGGVSSAPVRPSFALYRHEISNFILPYERVRTMAAPDDVVLDFFQAAYAAAADLGAWDRLALDRPEHEWP